MDGRPDPTRPAGTRPGATRRGDGSPAGPGPRLTLEEAKALAFRLNPRLEQSRASVDSRGERADRLLGVPADGLGQLQLPGVLLGRRVRRGPGPIPGAPGPGFRAGDAGLHVTEAQLRWNVFQFGRQIARHGQSVLRVEIARLQYRADRPGGRVRRQPGVFPGPGSPGVPVSAEQALVRAEAILKDAGDL